MFALLAFGAVLGLGMWYRQSRAAGLSWPTMGSTLPSQARVATPLASRLLPPSVTSVWSNPSAALTTPTDVDDAEMGASMMAMQPNWTTWDAEDMDQGLAMRGIF